jgi:hypothetical protein
MPERLREAEKENGTGRLRDAFAGAGRAPAKNAPQEKPPSKDGLARHFEEAQRKEPANDDARDVERQQRRDRGLDREL